MALGGHKKVHVVAVTEKAPPPAPVSASTSAVFSSRSAPAQPPAQRRTPEQTSFLLTPSVSPQRAPTVKPPPRVVVPILRPLTELPPRRRSETDSETDSLPQTPASALFAAASNVPSSSTPARIAEAEAARTFEGDAYYLRNVDPVLIMVSHALPSLQRRLNEIKMDEEWAKKLEAYRSLGQTSRNAGGTQVVQLSAGDSDMDLESDDEVDWVLR